MKRGMFGQSGASIIELLAAVGVFAIVVVGLSPSLLSAKSVADLGKDRAIATTLAADKLEYLRQSGASLLVTGSDGPLNSSGGTTNGIFTRHWTITPDSPIAGLTQILVYITWNERGTLNRVDLVAVAHS